ncbi:hypothetical protein CJU90_0804 [Yarrowia sp. C11]|nr:hypothetical protein CKK34_2225 [Yarrowia sp. E02]KAG5373133.1 hypothetical protein CJU90_0804 [Yarrowia sp. C11]
MGFLGFSRNKKADPTTFGAKDPIVTEKKKDPVEIEVKEATTKEGPKKKPFWRAKRARGEGWTHYGGSAFEGGYIGAGAGGGYFGYSYDSGGGFGGGGDGGGCGDGGGGGGDGGGGCS